MPAILPFGRERRTVHRPGAYVCKARMEAGLKIVGRQGLYSAKLPTIYSMRF